MGATAIPHAEILEFVKPIVAKEGLDLDIRVFTDYIQPNAQLVSGELDANYYQYRPFLYDYNKQRGTNLVAIVPVHIEPFVAYSRRSIRSTSWQTVQPWRSPMTRSMAVAVCSCFSSWA